MKKTIIIFSIILILIIGIGIYGIIWYKKEQAENIRIDAEAVTLKENLTVEFGADVKVSDFIENLNGTYIDDYKINTEILGDIEVAFDFINIKNKKRTALFNIKTVDSIAPAIYCGGSYTVKTGFSDDITLKLFSGDNLDDNPTREIIGDVDYNTQGDYNVKYVVTDHSGNSTEKDMVIHVVDKIKNTPASTPEPNYWDDIITNYKTTSTKLGIDVSKWQGEIDWNKVKEAGVEFVIIRVGYQTDYDGGYSVDPYFKKNIEGANNVGIPVGIYFYSYAKNVSQAIEQAEWVNEQLKGYKVDLPIAFDWESWSSFNKAGMSFYTINKVANTFLDRLSEYGYKGLLYGSKNYLEKVWYFPTKHDIWLAHYTSKTTYQGNYSIWQMCDTGRINGINGNVDIDIMYK